MEISRALEFAKNHHGGALVTIGKTGRPQLTNIVYALFSDGRFRISVTDSRQKTKNMQRDPRVSLFVQGESPWQYVVVDGTAELSEVASTPNDAIADELVALYRDISGDHPNWDEYRASMCAEHRQVVRLTPDHAYGILPD